MRVDRRIAPPAPSGRPRAFVVTAACAMLACACAHAQAPFTVSSEDLTPGGRVGTANLFDRGDCKGENRSPQLSWRNPPPGTQGYAVTMFDPDAPGRGWWHWAVTGIPRTVTSLPADASASGFLRRIGASEARNDFGTDGYGGPCPPPGRPHRYVITVYALKATDLRVAQGRPAPMFEHEIGTETIGTARLVVRYGQ
ncbi:YbhB/YbcL family Raf kinase inhibitor-like protein [Burkholderia multivorans]|uniref:YbhB/YbcL family Raf kinase inhibitor-like protein n=1 Tax=Burkholderia multivorans TaxID=87883 RepID=A0A2S9M6A6_9BURK|nr:YbhB/YbcL family Raf kinase inhibitor-like protein [Burkholderia multivorans]AYY96176.1 YbhB/YbcL family Raf kinase inhibitor-like protein [Burkholderia multivorans]KVP21893.1 phosphatidylethanolamine-binding protein [Burkholderia multivorans]MBU9122759.1 YbhB/YbcL family Raf kinase inhibitor-like protein [Burkholderia multivorans]MBU9146325.1 YbhB/YbcL family Raf kinase inhibitor-like protein [Burkholderia multivorans]MBU9515899.1 YbhB/YbcL family Raf kinase inhibitor-like protein [Burkhol